MRLQERDMSSRVRWWLRGKRIMKVMRVMPLGIYFLFYELGLGFVCRVLGLPSARFESGMGLGVE